MALSNGRASIFSICVFVVVSWIGALIIMGLEYHGLTKLQFPQQINATLQMQRFLRKKLSVDVNATNVELIMEEMKKYIKVDHKEASNSWKNEISLASFRKWHYFVTTTISTVGYGDVYPETTGGKIFAILFSLMGIPVFTYMIATVGSLFCLTFSRVKYWLKKDMLKQQVEQKVTIFCVMQCMAITLSFVVISGLVRAVNEGWSYFDGVYFSFVTFTTIGYGDLTPSMASKWSEILSAVDIIGLVLMAMTLNAIVKLVELKQNCTKPIDEERKPASREIFATTTSTTM